MKLYRIAMPLALSLSTTIMWRSTVAVKASAEPVIELERAALDRWGKGDPQGYVETYAPDITYFDPFTEKRVDGLPAIKEMLRPFVGKIHIDHYEMLNPRVQGSGDLAVLTYNLRSHVKQA